MISFDVLAGALLLVSAIFGYLRGATREITTVAALLLAEVIAVAGLKYTVPLAERFVHTPLLANAAAMLGLFVVAYIGLRFAAGAVSRSMQSTETLSSLDRVLGFGVGAARGLVALGVFALLGSAALPADRQPAWFTQARLYPVAIASADALKVLAPKGMDLFHDVAPQTADADGGAPTDDEEKAKLLDKLAEKLR